MKPTGLIQFIKFGLVGISNTVVDWLVFYILVSTAMPDYRSLAKAISFSVAVLNSYLWNTVWTFKKEYQKVGKNSADKSAIFVKFVVVSLIGWGINVAVYTLAAKTISYQIFNRDLVPLVLASGAAVVLNFFGNKLWTYKK